MLKHIPHYVIVLSIFIVIFLSRLFFAFDEKLFIKTLYLLAFIYVVWGIAHHCLEHDLTFKIVVEYILIAAVAMLIILLALRGGLP